MSTPPSLITSLAVLALVLLGNATPVIAQGYYNAPQGPAPGPTVSPYLNLANRRLNPAITYYGIVRPQVGYNQTLAQQQTQLHQLQHGSNLEPLRREIDQLPQRLREDLGPQKPGNDPPAGFMNYSHYYHFGRRR